MCQEKWIRRRSPDTFLRNIVNLCNSLQMYILCYMNLPMQKCRRLYHGVISLAISCKKESETYHYVVLRDENHRDVIFSPAILFPTALLRVFPRTKTDLCNAITSVAENNAI